MIRINVLSIPALLCVFSISIQAQNVSWEAVPSFQTGICRDMLQTPGGALLLAGPVGHAGRMGRGVFRVGTDPSDLADVSPTWSPIADFVLPGDGSILCASDDAIWRSIDDGRRWMKKQDSLLGPFNALARLRDGYCYALTAGGALFRSTDHGQAWDTVSTSLPAFGRDWDTMDFIGMNHLHWFIVGSPWTRIFSTDVGRTWKRHYYVQDSLYRAPYLTGVDAISVVDGAIINGGQGRQLPDWSGFEGTSALPDWKHRVRATDIASDGLTSHFTGVGVTNYMYYNYWLELPRDSTGVLVSRDDGRSWQWLLHGLDVQSLELLGDGDLMVSTLSEGFFRVDTANGNATPLRFPYGHVADLLANGNEMLAVSDSCNVLGALRTGDGGTSWSWSDSLRVSFSNTTPRLRRLVDGSLLRQGVYEIARSTDNGRSWDDCAYRLGANWWPIYWWTRLPDGSYLTVEMPRVDSSQQDCMLYRLDSSFTETARMRATGLGQIYDLHTTSGGVVFAAASNGLFSSSDNGVSWFRHSPVACSVIAPGIDGRIQVGGRNAMLYSDDDGASWMEVYTDPTLSLSDLVGRGREVFFVTSRSLDAFGVPEVGSGDGIRSGTMTGGVWTEESRGLPTKKIISLAVDAQGFLWAGTQGFGLYRSSGPVLDIDTSPAVAVTETLALTLFPLPVQERATIRLELSTEATVRLELYDLLGRHIRTVAEPYHAAGTSYLRFNATGLPAGTYMLVAHADDMLARKRIVLR
jgi:hypothetical protein